MLSLFGGSRANAEVAARFGDSELLNVWSLLHVTADACLDSILLDHSGSSATRRVARRSPRGLGPEGEGDGDDMAVSGCTDAMRPWRHGPLGQVRQDDINNGIYFLGKLKPTDWGVCLSHFWWTAIGR